MKIDRLPKEVKVSPMSFGSFHPVSAELLAKNPRQSWV
jgi:hypothetical protein